jgi:hypothetical protein
LGFFEMLSSKLLLCTRRYDDALVQARREVARGDPDSFKIGPALTIVKALLLLGRYAEAAEYADKLASTRHVGARVGPHFTYAGLAKWFQGQFHEAVRIWEAGLRANYQAQEGMEIPWVIYFAAARHPDCYSRGRATALVRAAARRLDRRSEFSRMNQFLQKQRQFDWVIRKLADDYGADPFARRWLMENRSLMEFFRGVHALLEDDPNHFFKHMLASATVTGYETTTAELILAEHEIQHGPLQYKRRFVRWLAENADVESKRNSRRRAKR